MEQTAVKLLCLTLLILVSFDVDARRISGGSRRTSSSSGSSWSSWSRPKPASKPQSTHSTHNTRYDNTRLSYGHDTSAARPAPKPAPSAPVDRSPFGTHNTGWNVGTNTNQAQKNTGWNTASNPSLGTNQGNKNIGWNVGTNTNQAQKNTGWNTASNPSQGTNQGNKNIGWNVGGSPAQPPSSNVGWNTGSNHPQGGFNQPRPGQVPPPYPGAPVGGAPPPYPGLGTQHHSPIGGAPPAYPGQSSSTFNRPKYPQQTWSQPNYNTPHGYGSPQGFGSPFGGYGGFGSPGHGYGGYGGGFGGGFGGGYNPYTAGAFAAPKKSGFGGVGSHVGTFLAGAMLMNLASNAGGHNYHVYHHYPTRVYTDSSGNRVYTQTDAQGNKINVTYSSSSPNEAKLSADFGNMTCITIYNARKFAVWANRTIKNIEYQTKQAFPFANMQNFSANQTGQIQFNFTLVPGRIIHNETVSITCCGTEDVSLDIDTLTNGKSPTANCVHLASKIPFRAIKVVPVNMTVNLTKNENNSTMNSTTAANVTTVSPSTVNSTVTSMALNTTSAVNVTSTPATNTTTHSETTTIITTLPSSPESVTTTPAPVTQPPTPPETTISASMTTVT